MRPNPELTANLAKLKKSLMENLIFCAVKVMALLDELM